MKGLLSEMLVPRERIRRNAQQKPRPRITSDDVDRFWRLVDLGDADVCWPWLGRRNTRGYGQFTVDGKSHGAHRISLFIATRKWPGRLWALHSCDNPPCVNPSHLRAGTAGDNAQDASERGRNREGMRDPLAFSNSPLADEIRLSMREAIRSAAFFDIYLPDGRMRFRALTPFIKEIARRHGVDKQEVYLATSEIREEAEFKYSPFKGTSPFDDHGKAYSDLWHH